MYIYYIKRAIDRCLFKKTKTPETLNSIFLVNYNEILQQYSFICSYEKEKKQTNIYLNAQ